MRISTVQLITSRNKEENLRKIQQYIEKAKDTNSELVVFPEASMFFSPPDESPEILYEKAEDLEGPWITEVKKSAKENGINVILGIYERSNNKKVYLTAVFIDKTGDLKYAYRKTHLYDAFSFMESERIEPGKEYYSPINIDGLKAGILLCYELRFPEISRTYALKGVDLLIVPAAWVKGYLKEDHLLTLAKARALENTSYLVLSAQIGNIFTGYSMVIDPLGVPISRATEKEGIITSEIDKERIKEVRDTLPVLYQRREDLYFR
ncbi:carbon-nitrogen hydrolase family protein [Acidianus brierleyi]|uniref:Amidohydrolase n=1 Tax=Acidianus brierleyi TaxID=41673 RepID=A0A2U9ICG4_9CREN|nr:carbon-nitrogen hydrolase family protein [Acidianus brierleyi]AWR93711.1 amidohydrolase [Acidianus brierleyi]